MFKITILISTLILTTSLYANYKEGKSLFEGANCLSCHEYEHFKSRKDKVNSYDKLYKTVSQCAYNNKVQWFDDELEDVVNYLNKDFYHFKKKAKK
ncbi:c-type cytochrome [Sulfurimonas sp.]